MAGECLSYGAFGAYSTNYNRYRGDSVRGSLPNFSGRRVDSWKNFLPIVKQTHSPLYCDKLVPSAEEYDHAEHAGIKGSIYLFEMSRHHLLHLASFVSNVQCMCWQYYRIIWCKRWILSQHYPSSLLIVTLEFLIWRCSQLCYMLQLWQTHRCYPTPWLC